MAVPWDGSTRTMQQKDGSAGWPEAINRELWSEWDKMTLGGRDVPGAVVVYSRKVKKTDTLDPLANSGAELTHLGYSPTELDITITLWTPTQNDDYEALLADVIPKAFPAGQLAKVLAPGQAASTPTPASAFSVVHPPLNQLGVVLIYIHDIASLVPGPVFGTRVAVWRATEIAPPVPIDLKHITDTIDFASNMKPSPGRPAPTQPVAAPSANGTGP